MVFFRKQSFSAVAATALLATSIGFVSGQEELTPEAFKAGIDNGSFDLVVDVRTQEEWDGGHIPTAIHIPNETFEENPFWNDLTSCGASCSTIVLYCSVGGRSALAIDKLKNMGFEATLLNGMSSTKWVEAGYELTMEENAAEPPCASTDICAADDSATTAEGGDELPMASDPVVEGGEDESALTVNGDESSANTAAATVGLAAALLVATAL